MRERKDLITLARTDTPWNELPSSERINLRAVELAFVGLQQSKLFQRRIQGRGVSVDEFLRGVITLDVLSVRVDDLFSGSLTDQGREKLGNSILSHVIGDRSEPGDLNGDTSSVREALTSWVQKEFGVDKNSPKV